MARKKKVQVKENPDLVRDTDNNAIINTNSNAFVARREQMASKLAQKEEMEAMKKDIAEIKELLKGLSK